MPHRSLLAVCLLATGLALLPARAAAVDRLNESPRRQEWVKIPSQGRALNAFLVFPETDRPVAAVLVIHEDRGLTDWVRTVVDRLAEAGHLAIAPDLLSAKGPNGGGTPDFQTSEATRSAVYELDPESVTADLQAVADFVSELPVANGVLTVAGFGWGGTQGFRFATGSPAPAAVFVFYGVPPGDHFESIACPVYGFYGGRDDRINATIHLVEDIMDAHQKVYVPQVYPQADHAYLRLGEEPEATDGNRIAMNASWDRWLALLAGHAEPEDEAIR